MTIAGFEIDAIYLAMTVSILVVAASLVGFCRACLLERRYLPYTRSGASHLDD
jgi:hypothetical protein